MEGMVTIMKINYFNQPKDMKLGDVLVERLSQEFDKVWILSGFTKDSGVMALISALEGSPIACKTVSLGIDKKNTSKDMLMRLLRTGAKVQTFINNDDQKLETRLYLFENKNGISYAYLSAGKLSEGGLFQNNCLITEIIYDKKDYSELEKLVLKINENTGFMELTEEDVIKMAESGEIVARITERKIPRISEMYQKEEVEIGIREYDESLGSSSGIREYDDVDIDIELPIEGSVKIKTSLGEEVEHVMKKANDKKKDEATEEGTKTKGKIIPKVKEPDFENMNALILALQNSDATEIKLGNSLVEKLTSFFDYPDGFHMVDEKGKLREMAEVELEIFENGEGKEVVDTNAKLYRRDKYLGIKSDVLKELEIEDGDVLRIIKQDAGKYRLELIRNKTAEHAIWEGYCIHTLKGNSRRYGIV